MAQLIDWIWNCIGRIANGWVLLALFVAVVLFWLLYFLPTQKKYRPARTFDGRAEGFRPSDAHAILEEFDQAGHLQTYLNQARAVDMIFPVVYALMFAVAIRFFAPHLTNLRWLILLPFVMALFDWIENLCVVTLIGRYRANKPFGGMPVLLLIAQRLKFLLWGAVIVVTVVLLVGWVRRL